MNINKINPTDRKYSPNFGAVVTINAKPQLLNVNELRELYEIGKKIGDNNTKIDMYAKYDSKNPYVYKFSQKTEVNVSEKSKSEKITFETDEEILTPTMKPVDYGKNILKRISAFIKNNTTFD